MLQTLTFPESDSKFLTPLESYRYPNTISHNYKFTIFV
uniref:Uncharacterized protein n=1 Tax=Leptospira santarosai serovar Arenal str. MAVJ 401 TaxID=1049976 RepID=M6K5Z9_9LEPT|nr:hypothetical protein LEP1GSC063_2624 [Leptospira santarosai serovar Arenal str. MAVJ 401]